MVGKSSPLTQSQLNMNVDDSSVYNCSFIKQKASAKLFKLFNRFASNHKITARFMGIGVGVAYSILGVFGRIGTTGESFALGVNSLIKKDGEAKRNFKNFGISLVKDVLLPFEIVGKLIGATVMIAKSPDVNTQNVFGEYHQNKSEIILQKQQKIDERREAVLRSEKLKKQI